MLRLTTLILLLSGVLWPQTAAPAVPAAQPPAFVQQIVLKEFGPGFTVLPQFAVLTGDLDGDGTEDAVIVATGKKVLVDQLDFHYQVIDPYNSFFGFGDPKVTSQFVVGDGSASRMLLIVHNWRAATPKAKYVVLNLPFKTVSISRELIKKKAVTTINAEDTTSMNSFIYWTGKKYKWEAGRMD